MSEVINVKDEEFDKEVLESKIPVLVEFWAEWCGPCKMMSPVLDGIAKEYSGKVKVVKINIDENQITAPKYGIRGLPSVLLMKGKDIVGQQIGAVSSSQLSSFVSQRL